MTSSIHLQTDAWTLLCDGACQVAARGVIHLTVAAAPPAAGAAFLLQRAGAEPWRYEGAENVYGRAGHPGAVAIVTGAAEAADVPPVAAVAPSVVTPPSITPSTLERGQTVTVTLGAASGVPAPRAVAELHVGGQRLPVRDGPIAVPRAGTLALEVEWRNGVHPNATASATATVTVPGAQAPANSWTATVGDLNYDNNVFGRRNTIVVPAIATDAPDGTDIEARLVRVSDPTVVHDGPVVIGQAASGALTGAGYALDGVPSSEDEDLTLQVRPAGSDAAWGGMATQFTIGLVVAELGQSELRQNFDAGDALAVAVADAAQVQLVRQQYSTTPGDPIGVVAIERAYLGAVSGHGYKTHAGEVFAATTTDRVMVIQLAISGTSRWYMSDDTDALQTNRRRWADDIAALEAAGWSDGVRPDVVVDMWTATDGRWGYDFAAAFTPFYTGRKADGTAYTLGEVITARNIEEGGTNDIRHDHILYDLTGQDRGLFDPAVTKLVICNHRHDNSNGVHLNWLGRDDNTIDAYIWGQWDLRVRQREMLATADFQQIALMGPDPQNYENGSEVEGANPAAWTDMLHPGATLDGHCLFARHLAHAALYGAGLVAQDVPEIDSVVFAGDGSTVTLRSSAGDLTTTRKLRGEAELVAGVGTEHWTEFGGIAINGIPVTSALPTGDGGIVVANPLSRPLDAARDRVSVGEVTMIDTQADPLNGWWKNYPVVDLGVPGLTVTNGIAVRPAIGYELAAPAYLAGTVGMQRDARIMPAGSTQTIDAIGGGALGGVLMSQLRLRARIALDTTFGTNVLFGIGGAVSNVNRFMLKVGPNRNLAVDTWKGPNTSSPLGVLLPGNLHEIVMIADFPGNAYAVYLDPADPGAADLSGETPVCGADLDAFSNFVGADIMSVFGGTNGLLPLNGGRLDRLQVWKNSIVENAANLIIDVDGSAGAAALNARADKAGAGLFV